MTPTWMGSPALLLVPAAFLLNVVITFFFALGFTWLAARFSPEPHSPIHYTRSKQFGPALSLLWLLSSLATGCAGPNRLATNAPWPNIRVAEARRDYSQS